MAAMTTEVMSRTHCCPFGLCGLWFAVYVAVAVAFFALLLVHFEKAHRKAPVT